MENFPMASIETFTAEKMGLDINDITKMDIGKGKFSLRHFHRDHIQPQTERQDQGQEKSEKFVTLHPHPPPFP